MSIRFTAGVCLVLLLTGCSIFGDRFRNRSLDYLALEQQAPTYATDGSELAAVDFYPVPELPENYQPPEKFVLPAPNPIDIDEASENTSLVEFQTNRLNPRLDYDGAGALVLQLEGSYTGLWAVVTDAIAASSLKLNDLNRSTGTWYLSMEKLVPAKERGWWARLWRKDKTITEIYQLKLSRTRLGGYLSLLKDAETLADAELNEQVLNEILKKLEP